MNQLYPSLPYQSKGHTTDTTAWSWSCLIHATFINLPKEACHPISQRFFPKMPHCLMVWPWLDVLPPITICNCHYFKIHTIPHHTGKCIHFRTDTINIPPYEKSITVEFLITNHKGHVTILPWLILGSVGPFSGAIKLDEFSWEDLNNIYPPQLKASWSL